MIDIIVDIAIWVLFAYVYIVLERKGKEYQYDHKTSLPKSD